MYTNTDSECFSVLPWKYRGSSNYASWNKLIAVHCENSIYIIQWNKRQMTVFQVHKEEVRDGILSALNLATEICQDVSIRETIVQIFAWSGKLCALTTLGYIKVMKFDEQTIGYLKDGKCGFNTIGFAPPPKKVLAGCPLNEDVLLLATVLNGHVSIDIYNVECSSNEMEAFLVDSVPLEKQEPHDGIASAVMCVCNANVASELIKLPKEQCRIVLVGLNTGSVLWLPFIKSAPSIRQAKKLYHAGRKVRDIISLEGNNNIFILLEGGVVIKVTSSKVEDQNVQQVENTSRSLQFDTIALPGSIREFCFSAKSNSIVCSEGISCWLVKVVTDNTETIMLPLKGVMGLLALPESDICLATTKHNTFYAVNVASEFSSHSVKRQTIQKCCDLETPSQYICELREKTNDLLQVEAALKLEDSVLAGISAAARGDILRTSFSGRVLVYDVDTLNHSDAPSISPIDTMYKLFVEVKNNSGLEFSANLWNMSISIVTRDGGVFSKTDTLPNSFVRGIPFSTSIYVRLRSSDLVSDVKVTVNLIAELPEPDQGRWISIPVFEEDLDVSYFLNVIVDTDKSVSQSSVVPVHDQINKLVGKASSSQQCSSYVMNLPQQFQCVVDLMQLLLLKCRHRCENFLKQIKGGTDQHEFCLSFGDTFVTMTFTPTVSALTITGTNTEMVHAVKLWIIRTLAKSDGDDSISPDTVLKAKWLRSVLEKEQLKQTLDVSNLLEIHSEVRNNVSAVLPL